jgi:hypothetical protein
MDDLTNLATALGPESDNPRQRNQESKKKPNQGSSGQTQQQEPGPSSSNKPKRKCYFCNAEHIVAQCPTLLTLSPANRLKKVTEKKLCKNCFWRSSDTHTEASCRSEACGVNGCQEKHNKLLHIEKASGGTKKEAQTVLSTS